MALFRITVKIPRNNNGIRVEKGMSVEVVSTHGNPVATNGGIEVAVAFMRKYGIDAKKAGILSDVYLQTERI